MITRGTKPSLTHLIAINQNLLHEGLLQETANILGPPLSIRV